MEQRLMTCSNGKYEVKIDITVEEWISMLQNPAIFDKNSSEMVLRTLSPGNFKINNRKI